MPRPHTRPGKPYRRIAPLLAGPALVGCALLLGGCDAIYDDTKGWANRLEASILDAAHKMGEAAEEEAPAAMTMPASETPPAVPLEPVDTAALPAPPPAAPEAAEAPQAAEAAQATETPALSAPGTDTSGAAAAAPGGLMAEAAKDLSAPAPTEAAKAPAADPAKSQTKMPPKPLPKPQMAAEAAPTAGTNVAVAPAAVPDAAAADAAVAMVLHLSSLRSEEAAKREWSDLQRSFPEPLGQMQAEFRRTELGVKGIYYRVLAGPLPSRDAARQVCDDLKAKKARQYCRIVPSQSQPQS